MKARLFGIIALAMVPTLALAADAGGAAKPDNAKAAGTGGGEGAAAASSTDDGSGKGVVPRELPPPLKARQAA